MAKLKTLAGLLFALSLRSSAVEPITSVAAAQDASLKMPAAAVLLNKLVTAATAACITDSLNLAAALPLGTRDKAAASAPIAVALAALIDCCVAPLARVARAVVRGRARRRHDLRCAGLRRSDVHHRRPWGDRACSHEARASQWYRCERRRGEERCRHNQPRAGSVCDDDAVLTAMAGAGKESAGEVGAC